MVQLCNVFLSTRGPSCCLFSYNLTLNGKFRRAIGFFIFSFFGNRTESLLPFHCSPFLVMGNPLDSVHLLLIPFNSCGQAEIRLGMTCALELSTPYLPKHKLIQPLTCFLCSPRDVTKSVTLKSSTGYSMRKD